MKRDKCNRRTKRRSCAPSRSPRANWRTMGSSDVSNCAELPSQTTLPCGDERRRQHIQPQQGPMDLNSGSAAMAQGRSAAGRFGRSPPRAPDRGRRACRRPCGSWSAAGEGSKRTAARGFRHHHPSFPFNSQPRHHAHVQAGQASAPAHPRAPGASRRCSSRFRPSPGPPCCAATASGPQSPSTRSGPGPRWARRTSPPPPRPR